MKAKAKTLKMSPKILKVELVSLYPQATPRPPTPET
jgi:hypothetical protein